MARNAVSPESGSAPASTRLAEMVQMANGLNGARVFASLLVVVFHAAIPYMVSPVPLWIAHDTARHVTVDLFVFWVNGFVMPLFFLLAGMSIAKSAAQKPFLEFAWHRCSRLGANFVLAMILILPVLLFSWAIGLLLTERLTISNLSRLRFPETLKPYIGPAHLWFLQYLLLMSVAWSSIARIGLRLPSLSRLVQGHLAQGFLRSAWAPFVCAVPAAALLVLDAGAPFRLISTFVPDLSRFLYYFTFLVAGVWLTNSPPACVALRQHAPRHLVFATLSFVGLFPLTLALFENRLHGAGMWALAGLQAIFAWNMVFGLMGGMIRWAGRPSEPVRFGNEASFWIYLAHLPIVCIMQVIVLPWELAPWFKISIVSVAGISLSLLLYEYCVRYSFLGLVLNGRRKNHATRRGWRLEAGWTGIAGIGVAAFAAFIFSGWNLLCENHLHPVVEGQVYRCNRPGTEELENILTKHHIRTVISLAAGHEGEHWVHAQQSLCDTRGIRRVSFSFSEARVPDRVQLRQLQQTLKESPKPVLLVGDKRSPTLAGFGSAVAVLMDEGSVEKAMEQFGLRYFQIEGAERCIVAQPLRAYRHWLQANQFHHTAELFSHWAGHEQATTDEKAERAARPEFEARMGAPRYPGRF